MSAHGIWVCDVLALDLDGLTVERLRETPIIDTLQGEGLHVYVSRGSTGRGCHLYAFLETSVPTEHAHASLRGIGDIVRAAAPATPIETFPSSGVGPGRGIYIPYRGAGEDGLGFNPLLDPAAWDRPILLDEAAARLVRTKPEHLFQFTQRQARTHNAPRPSPQAGPHTDATLSPVDRFDIELTRLITHWRVGVRNLLVKGLTAYALDGLRIEPETILDGIRSLHHASSLIERPAKADLTKLLAAASRTIKRSQRGEAIAWYTYYDQAGVAPPPTVGRSQDLTTRLQALTIQSMELAAAEHRNLTDQALYEALVRLAFHFGRAHKEGIIVRVSRRDLALRANLSDNGARKALDRLAASGLVIKVPGNKRGEPGSIVITDGQASATQRTQSTPSHSQVRADQDWVRCFEHPAFRRSGLGQLAALVVCALRKAQSQTLSTTDLSRQLRRRPWRIAPAIRRLAEHGIITVADDGALTLAADADTRLDDAADAIGATRRRANQHARHMAERAAYHLSRSARVPSGGHHSNS